MLSRTAEKVTFVVVLFLVALMFDYFPSTDATEECHKGCDAYKQKDPMPVRFDMCKQSCDMEDEATKGIEMTLACYKACEEGKDPARMKTCKDACAILDDATTVTLVVGKCYKICVTSKEDPADFGKCKEACDRADKGGADVVKNS